MSKTLRYIIFSLLYFIQGAILSYFTGFNAIYLLSFGVDMKGVGLIGLIGMLPFVLKSFWGCCRIRSISWGWVIGSLTS